MQVAANALQSGDSVIWVGQCCPSVIHTLKIVIIKHSTIDTSYILPGPRFRDILSHSSPLGNTDLSNPSPAKPLDSLLENFHHYHARTLPHLLALMTHSSPSFPPPKTSVIIVDAVSILFALAFPKSSENFNSSQPLGKRSDAAQWAASRRWAVMGDFISKIGKLAVTRNIAILLVSQMTTRIRAETGAVLHPALASTAWDSGISARVVLWRDWVYHSAENLSQREFIPGVRFAGVIKAGGICYQGLGKVVSFTIDKVGQNFLLIRQKPLLTPPARPPRNQHQPRGHCH